MIRELLAYLLGVPKVTVELINQEGIAIASQRVFWVTEERQGKMFTVPLTQPVKFKAADILAGRPQATIIEVRIHAWGKETFFYKPLEITLTHPSDAVALTIEAHLHSPGEKQRRKK